MPPVPKNPPLRDPEYLAWQRTQPDIITGQLATEHESVVPMHIGTAGKGIKAGDDETLPILNHFHQLGHQHGEISMLRQYLPDPILRAALRALGRENYRAWKARQK